MSQKGKTIKISPVTRVEGHGAITIQLDPKGNVADAHFHVMDVRGFEIFMQDRPVEEAQRIATRMCGICPVSHHLASAHAADALYGVDPPKTAKMLRELMHHGQMIHSHTLHFFYLAAPDILLPGTGPEERHVVTLLKQDPAMVGKIIRLRQVGQNLIEATGGRAIHPVTAQPGGISKPITEDTRADLLKQVEEAQDLATELLGVVRPSLDQVELLDELQTGYLGLVTPKGELEVYQGNLRMIDATGKKLAEFPVKDYLKYIGEHVTDYSYLKFPFYKPWGWPKGIYRVGPLGRINVADDMSTPIAREEYNTIKAQFDKPWNHTFLYHWARLTEIINSIEHAQHLLNHSDITGTDTMREITPKGGEGIGVIEAPRGTLIHHYKANNHGILTRVNLIVSTVSNNGGMDLGVKNMAQRLIKHGKINPIIMSDIEMVVRAYDPCLSCAVHSINGHLALRIEVLNHLGETTQVIQNLDD
jgi:F420-non-reducing hydrogenase large subunit